MDDGFIPPGGGSHGHGQWDHHLQFGNSYAGQIDDLGVPGFAPQSSAAAGFLSNTSSLEQAQVHSTEQAPQIGQPHTVDTRRARQRPRDLDWDAHKVELQNLWLDGKRTLEEIREHMTRERSFVAS